MSGKTIAELQTAWQETEAQNRATIDILAKMQRASEGLVDEKQEALRKAWEQIAEETKELSVDNARWRVLKETLKGSGEAAGVYVDSAPYRIRLRVSDARTIAAWLIALADRVEGKA